MIPRLITSGVLAAVAGAAMTVAVSSSPSFAFTLSSPSVTDKVTKADVRKFTITAAITTTPITITTTTLIITPIIIPTTTITTITLTTITIITIIPTTATAITIDHIISEVPQGYCQRTDGSGGWSVGCGGSLWSACVWWIGGPAMSA
jgi:hypothetical protein